MMLKVLISSANEAMQYDDVVVDLLEDVIGRINSGNTGGHLSDPNGNTVGEWFYEKDTANYRVIEYTAGYLPENDDPAEFDNYDDALSYVSERHSTLIDESDGDSNKPLYEVSEINEGQFTYVFQMDTPGNLTRIVEIVPTEQDNGD